MVAFVSDSATKQDIEEASKRKNSNHSFEQIDHSVLDIDGLGFSPSLEQSFLDWVKDIPDTDSVLGSERIDFFGLEKFLDMDVVYDSCVKIGFQDHIVDEDAPMVIGAGGSNLVLDGNGSVVKVGIQASDVLGGVNAHTAEILEGTSTSVAESHSPVKVEIQDCGGNLNDKSDITDNVNFCIENELGKVKLVDGAGDTETVEVNNFKISGEESESESSSSSSFSSSEKDSSDEDDDTASENKQEKVKDIKMKGNTKEKVVHAGPIEEGEIRDGNDDDDDGDDDEIVKGVVASSDDDFIDADFLDTDDEGGTSGPIRSKNELKFLPPVPPVDVTLQPNHQTVPVGVILSVLGTQVIIEGVEKHNPLNEGSILWITERRIPLGLVDEIFGPVKNPYYIVRYNSENEVPEQIHEGTLISFVPEFAHHVLNDKNVYKKGYDASGDNDEEVDDTEFSDDEKEAEYRKMLKNTKRGMTMGEQKQGHNMKNNRKKTNDRDGNRKMNRPLQNLARPRIIQSAPNVTRGGAQSLNRGQPGFGPTFPQPEQSDGLIPTLIGSGVNGMQNQPQPNVVFANGFPTQNMPWPQQNNLQIPYQMMPIMNGMPFQQPGFFPNAVLQGGQPSLIAGQAYSPWAGFMGQSGFNPTAFGMGLQGQQAHPSQNVGGQWVPFQNTGGQGIPFQNTGGQGLLFFNTEQGTPPQNIGGQGPPPVNTGGQGAPPQNTGGQGAPPQNIGGQGPPHLNTGGHGVPPLNTARQGFPSQKIGHVFLPQNTGHGVSPLNTGGQGHLPQNVGGKVFPQNTGGHGIPSQNMGDKGTTSTGLCVEENDDAPPGFPVNTESPPHFNSGISTGRGRIPNHRGRGRGRFSRGRN